jgi:hypothetical protein
VMFSFPLSMATWQNLLKATEGMNTLALNFCETNFY